MRHRAALSAVLCICVLVGTGVEAATAQSIPQQPQPRASINSDHAEEFFQRDQAGRQADSEVVGNVPFGNFVEEADAECPSGTRLNRYFYGSSMSLSGIMATDPQNEQCDDDAEVGEAEVGALVLYHWTTWPAGHPDEGLRCAEQFDADGKSLGSVPLAEPTADPDGEGALLEELWICKVTTHFGDYEGTVYRRGNGGTEQGHPWVGSAAKPGNVSKSNWGWLTGMQRLQTWGCDWVGVAPALCKTAAGDLTDEPCNPDCHAAAGCGLGSDTEYQQLELKEMVVEVVIKPEGAHPPDVYLYKPSPARPDGFPAGSPFPAAEWLSQGDVAVRVANYMSASLRPSDKQSASLGGVGHGADGDVLIALATNHAADDDLPAAGADLYILFDDHASASLPSSPWASGAYGPEDRLGTFAARAGGAGTWVLLTADDCDAGGADAGGAEVSAWQLHFVCRARGFCTAPPPAGDATDAADDAADSAADSAAADADPAIPHMIGFRGQSFSYHGVPGRHFNVISTPRTQLNAWLNPERVGGRTVIGSVGLSLADGTRLQVAVIPGLGELHVDLNDVPVVDDVTRGDVSVVWLDDYSVRVVGPELRMVVSLHGDEEYLDIGSLELRARPDRIHGVIGNTANLPATAGLAGDEADYLVSGLWASDFAYSAFVGDLRRKPAKRLGPLLKDALVDVTEVVVARMMNNHAPRR